MFPAATLHGLPHAASQEPVGPQAESRGLSAYLSLPLDQYSLLDPGWIAKCPGSPDMFVLRIPLFDLVGLELQPQISVRVAADPQNSQFKLGDPKFDADLKLAMRATLRNKPVPTLRPFRWSSGQTVYARAAPVGDLAAAAAANAAAMGGSVSLQGAQQALQEVVATEGSGGEAQRQAARQP
ncbi:hypothetical protein GPECTOR_7g1117 [Gonium pectorale]|uniref:Uncharacterized protein n=1 Tax=Gonium pectorale TaxID=33097 RepID=A0A150GTW0_GONPE|nr:hypothetical protein GPECTOR_7g1117 [Gonium pectorale]|eukprot:KXZ53224.1 hypothetical protein GPECTOR_7g1117 [Gonium pectorale]